MSIKRKKKKTVKKRSSKKKTKLKKSDASVWKYSYIPPLTQEQAGMVVVSLQSGPGLGASTIATTGYCCTEPQVFSETSDKSSKLSIFQKIRNFFRRNK